jgi:hypothetical protein
MVRPPVAARADYSKRVHIGRPRPQHSESSLPALPPAFQSDYTIQRMRETSTLENWKNFQSRRAVEPAPRMASAKKIGEILALAGVCLNGREPWDLQVYDPRFYRRVLAQGSLGIGESYMDGWWDAAALDQLWARLQAADLYKKVGGAKTLWLALKSRILNLQTKSAAKKVAEQHYDLGNIPARTGRAQEAWRRPSRTNCI